MTHRKTRCDVCDGNLITIRKKMLTYPDGSYDDIYEERCAMCENLLYGYTKKEEEPLAVK